MPAAPVFFATAADFGAWLATHHATARELVVGLHKKGTGRPSMTWPESVDEALCYGWIDGVRRSLGEESYSIRFGPRRAGSRWSEVNLRRFEELRRLGRVSPAGEAAFARREPAEYSYQQRREATLDEAAEQRFRAEPEAWRFFQSQPPSYRRTAVFWVTSAKREETRRRRLARLVADSGAGLRIAELRRPSGKGNR